MARLLTFFVLLATILAPYSSETRVVAEAAVNAGTDGGSGHHSPTPPSTCEVEDPSVEEAGESEDLVLRGIVTPQGSCEVRHRSRLTSPPARQALWVSARSRAPPFTRS